MLIGFYLLLMLTVGRCTNDQVLVMETAVGQHVTLTCTRQKSQGSQGTLFWIRLVSGNMPEGLGATFDFDYDGVNSTPRITAYQAPGTFLLNISKTELNDTGLYYCIKVVGFKMTFLKGTFLRIKGPEPDITAIIQDFPSDPVRPGDFVTLQCSVLSVSEEKTCPEGYSVYWFRAASVASHPSLIYTQRNSSDGCGKSPDSHTSQKCVYSLSMEVSSSDAGTYHCAVASCGEILFGNGTKLDVAELNMMDLEKTDTILFVLCVALVISVGIISYLIYTNKRKTCACCYGAVALQTNAATASGDQQSLQRDEDTLMYAAPTFTKRKTGKAKRANAETAEGEMLYASVRV